MLQKRYTLCILSSYVRTYVRKLNLRGCDGNVIRKQCRPIHFLMHDMSSREYFLLTRKHCYIGRASIFEYPWHAVNIFTCILLCVHSSCTRTKIISFVWVPRENTSVIVNLVVSCTVGHCWCNYTTASLEILF